MAEASLYLLMVSAGHLSLRAIRAMSPLAQLAAGALFVSALLVSVFSAPFPLFAIARLGISMLHGLVALAMWDLLGTRWRGCGNQLLSALIGGIAVYAIAAWTTLYLVRDTPGFDWKHVGFGISHVRHFSYLAVIAAGAAIGFLVLVRSERQRCLAVVALAIAFALCLWAGSRAGAVAIMGTAVFALVLSEQSRVRTGILIVVGLVSGVALSLIWVPADPLWGLPRLLFAIGHGAGSATEYTSNRTVLWQRAWALFLEQPLLGYGEGQFRFLSRAGWVANHPHSAPLQFLVQWGVVGTLAIAILITRAVPRQLLRFRRPPMEAAPALCGIVALGAEAAIDGPLFYVYPTFATCLMLVILARSRCEGAPEASVQSRDGDPANG